MRIEVEDGVAAAVVVVDVDVERQLEPMVVESLSVTVVQGDLQGRQFHNCSRVFVHTKHLRGVAAQED